MRWYELRLLRELDKDAVPVNCVNRSTIKKFKKAGYVKSLGPAPKGREKGKECVLIQPSGVDYWEKLKKERKEDRRFWIALWMNPISAIIGAITGFALAKLWP